MTTFPQLFCFLTLFLIWECPLSKGLNWIWEAGGDNIWERDGFKQRENRAKWSETVGLFIGSSLGTFHEIYHFLPFSKRVRAVAVANKFPEEKTIWERKNKKFELCLHSSLKINCLIFSWKESEVWQSAMSLVKSWKLRKVSQKVRQRKARSTFTGGFNRHQQKV